ILRRRVDLNDTAALSAIVQDSDIDLRGRDGQLQVILDGQDVSALIRTPEVSQMASKASAIPMVRHRLLHLQRELGRRGNVVAEGRDIGTVVFPDAQVKIYLDASIEERARRRCHELRAAGREVSLAETISEMKERDKRDSERDIAPLRKADDAFAIDSSGLTVDGVAEKVLQLVKSESSKLKNDRSLGI
ncbi:MAG TPA: (d)CMP kinase, partial [Terriglobia bacterium]|nr:(d)CMP kinase [Terriglobia bacterium]